MICQTHTDCHQQTERNSEINMVGTKIYEQNIIYAYLE